MITHKIRIYPNCQMKAFLQEQFEYRRRDYNRQLQRLLRGLDDGSITWANLQEALMRIEATSESTASFYHPGSFHYVDIIRANNRDLLRQAKSYLSKGTRPFFLSRHEHRSCFRIGIRSHRETNFSVSGKYLSIGCHGVIRMAETLRFTSEPFRVEFSRISDVYYASFLFTENPAIYPSTGKAIGVSFGLTPLLTSVDSDGKKHYFDFTVKKSHRTIRHIEHLKHLMERKGENYSSKRFLHYRHRLEKAFLRQRHRRDDFAKQTIHYLLSQYDIVAISPADGIRKLYRQNGNPWHMRKPFMELYYRLLSSARFKGRRIHMQGREYPPRVICGYCMQEKGSPLAFLARNWVCPHCSRALSRWENEAIVAMRFAFSGSP